MYGYVKECDNGGEVIMLNVSNVSKIYLAPGVTDFRKSINGLSQIVQNEFELDPFQSELFIFCNRERDKLKILHWEHNGFWLYYRRLEGGKFKWPSSETIDTVSQQELKQLLEGWPIIRGVAHKKLELSIA